MSSNSRILLAELGQLFIDTDPDDGDLELTHERADRAVELSRQMLAAEPSLVSTLHEVVGVASSRAMFWSFETGANIADSPWSSLSDRLLEVTGPFPDPTFD